MSNELEKDGAMVMNLERFGVDGHGVGYDETLGPRPHLFFGSIFIDQATLNGTRPVTPVDAGPSVTPSGC